MNSQQSHLVQQIYQPTIQKVTQEYRDILPIYSSYVEHKKNYQLNKESIESVENAFKLLLSEIYEFLDILYVSTENTLERDLILSMITKFKDKHKKESTV